MNQQIHRFRVGDFRCAVVADGHYSGTAEMLFTNAPAGELTSALTKHQETADNLPAGQNCLLVDTGQNKVLIDTGLGAGTQPGTGKLLENLALAGIQPADIDTVFITHCHGDHIGGVTDESGKLTFPNARHFMWQLEWEYWTDEASLTAESAWSADFARRKLAPLAGKIDLVSQAGDIVPGISVTPAPGHTVGHTAVILESASEELLYLADTTLHPIHIEHPDWVATVDRDPALTIASRKKLLAGAANSRPLVLAYHFMPFPGLGQIVFDEEGFTWQPDQESG